jgi:hypothetical protein
MMGFKRLRCIESLNGQHVLFLLAPLLSSFNTQLSWMIDWQTDQLASKKAIFPSQLSKFLSTWIVPVSAQQSFYFSVGVNATGKQLVQVSQSREQTTAKCGENLTLDPSYIIPAHQGELVFIGDILLKDASLTPHRSQYLKYFLSSEVLSIDVPAFDLNLSRKDPVGHKTFILTVHCGKSVAVSVTQSLSASLNGDGTNPKMFISH